MILALLLALSPGQAVIVPFLPAEQPRVVTLSTGATLICWRMLAEGGWQCRPMSREGWACELDDGRVRCVRPEREDLGA